MYIKAGNSTWFCWFLSIWFEEPLTSLCHPTSKTKHAPLVFLKAVTQLLCVQSDGYFLIESHSDSKAGGLTSNSACGNVFSAGGAG